MVMGSLVTSPATTAINPIAPAERRPEKENWQERSPIGTLPLAMHAFEVANAKPYYREFFKA
jgi:hypothetical protein